jgi:HAMP domain-containing protein
MTIDPGNLLVLLLSIGLAFLIARLIASRWKARRLQRSERAARDGESRQVRRAGMRRRRK